MITLWKDAFSPNWSAIRFTGHSNQRSNEFRNIYKANNVRLGVTIIIHIDDVIAHDFLHIVFSIKVLIDCFSQFQEKRNTLTTFN